MGSEENERLNRTENVENAGTGTPGRYPGQEVRIENPEGRFAKVRPLKEVAAGILTYIAAFVYTSAIFASGEYTWIRWFASFVGLFIVTGILLYRSRKPKAEDIVWLFCLVCCTVGLFREKNGHGVWTTGWLLFFTHAFGVWWAISRSGGLLENETGHLMPIDVIRAFFVIPIRHFLLQAKTLIGSLAAWFMGRKKGTSGRIGWAILAVFIALAILISAVSLMGQADQVYGEMLDKLIDFFTFDLTEDMFFTCLKICVSIPVSAYLYGLLGGLCYLDESELSETRQEIGGCLSLIRKVPDNVWTVVIAVFSVFYLLFFILQGQFLFGAFTGRLPEGYTLSGYARQGFFELCKVISLNFVLLWFVTRMSRDEIRPKMPLYIASVLLLAESMVFCLIAFSKIFLYIRTFGFTPLRLESIWLTVVLFAACAAWIAALSGRKTFKYWAVFGAVTLSLLTLY